MFCQQNVVCNCFDCCASYVLCLLLLFLLDGFTLPPEFSLPFQENVNDVVLKFALCNLLELQDRRIILTCTFESTSLHTLSWKHLTTQYQLFRLEWLSDISWSANPSYLPRERYSFSPKVDWVISHLHGQFWFSEMVRA